MIVLQADVWPFGEKGNAASLELARLIIVNDRTGTFAVGNYDVFDGLPDKRDTWRHVGRIEGVMRGAGSVALLVSALELLTK